MIRHGERLDSITDEAEITEFGGGDENEYDCYLSKKGHAQAYRTGEFLKAIIPDSEFEIKFWSSPFARCL